MYRTAFLLTPPAGVIWRSYYYSGAARIALREDSDAGSEVYYILTDHLGSTALTYRASNGLTSRQWFTPWGETRPDSSVTATDYAFTGQRTHSLGMLWYTSRFYDPKLGRWSQPDTVVPLASQGVQAWDRFAYVNNSPVRYTDPTGQDVGCGSADASQCISYGIRNDSTVISMEESQELFELMASQEDIAFRYPDDGCYARAHIMGKRMMDEGVVPGKVWIEASSGNLLRVETKYAESGGGYVNWKWHVAIVVMVKASEDEIVPMVIDPSLFNKPVTVDVWKSIMGDSNAKVTVLKFNEALYSDINSSYWPYWSDPKKNPNDPMFADLDFAANEKMKVYKQKEQRILQRQNNIPY